MASLRLRLEQIFAFLTGLRCQRDSPQALGPGPQLEHKLLELIDAAVPKKIGPPGLVTLFAH